MRTERMSKKIWNAILAVFLAVIILLGVMQLGVVCQSSSGSHWKPNYKKIEIFPLLEKTERTKEDYEVLYKQTGLTKLAIDGFLSKGEKKKIQVIQNRYFEDYEVISNSFAPFTYTEEIDGSGILASLEEGDILITLSVYTSFFRYGHCALVVDAENETVVECVSIGENSEETSADFFTNYANFLVFRPKMSKETRKEVAVYARNNLIDLPYDLTTGVLSPKFKETPIVSQCAHLVWYAYKRFGLDLDANGGAIVLPYDLAKSPNLELVQSFGINPDTL